MRTRFFAATAALLLSSFILHPSAFGATPEPFTLNSSTHRPVNSALDLSTTTVTFGTDQIPQAKVTGLTTSLSGKVNNTGNESITGIKTFSTLNIAPTVTSPMTGTIFDLAGPSYWSATNSLQPNPLVSFAGPGNDAGSLNAYFMTAQWGAGTTQKGYTLSVENIVPSNAPSFGSAAAIYGGLLNYLAGTDGAGVIGVINNVTGIAPVGAAMWGIVRGPNASAGPVDGIRSTSETDGAEHPQYGVIVNNSTANNAFKFGFIVAGAGDFGFCVGLGSNSPTEVVPTYPFAFRRKTDAQIRFNVDNTGMVTGSRLSVADSDIWSVPWYLAHKTGGLLKLSYGSEEVVNIIPAALGGPSIAIPGGGSLDLGFGTEVRRMASDGRLQFTSQSGSTEVTGSLRVSGTAATFTSGSGSPNGVVTAPPGSTYTNTAGGAVVTFYVKESGTGNTGWVGK
ncbi:MAG: hypothetical protein V7609_2075 [Verrucomicrobiota bacterium]